jgi:hypothetical protein
MNENDIIEDGSATFVVKRKNAPYTVNGISADNNNNFDITSIVAQLSANYATTAGNLELVTSVRQKLRSL